MKLYEITESIKHIEQQLEDDSSSSLELHSALDNLEVSFNEKAECIIALIKNHSAHQDILSSEISRLKSNLEASKKKTDSLKNYLRKAIESIGVKEAGSGIHTAKLTAPRKSVSITDEKALPVNYKVIKTEAKPDKEKIMEDLKNGVFIEGAEINEGEAGLKIK